MQKFHQFPFAFLSGAGRLVRQGSGKKTDSVDFGLNIAGLLPLPTLEEKKKPVSSSGVPVCLGPFSGKFCGSMLRSMYLFGWRLDEAVRRRNLIFVQVPRGTAWRRCRDSIRRSGFHCHCRRDRSAGSKISLPATLSRLIGFGGEIIERHSVAHGGHRRGIVRGAAGTESHDRAEWTPIPGESACRIVIFLIHATRFRSAWCLCLGSCERIEIGLARLARARLIGNLSSLSADGTGSLSPRPL
jgi:hypothetical protein